MKNIAFITVQDAELGFNLAGTDQYVSDEKNLIAILKNIIQKPDTGLVIIDERLINPYNEEKLREAERIWYGVIIVLPSPERQTAEIEDYASRLIRRAIGYHVRLHI
jgi:V/A-type H+-transporting ATPase subunit F